MVSFTVDLKKLLYIYTGRLSLEIVDFLFNAKYAETMQKWAFSVVFKKKLGGLFGFKTSLAVPQSIWTRLPRDKLMKMSVGKQSEEQRNYRKDLRKYYLQK